MQKEIRGTGVALITPFYPDGTVDYDSLRTLVDFTVINGVDFIVALGTTAESATLSHEEKRLIMDTILSANRQRVPIVIGIGGNCTSEVCKNISEWDFTGIAAILSVAPFYNKPSQEGIYLHFKKIAETSSIPLILYNVPSRTVVNIDSNTVIRLANDCKNIIGIKEASGNFSQITEIIKNAPNEFIVLSGDDFTTLPLLSLGGHGVISVIGNALPQQTALMVHKALMGDFRMAREMHFLMHSLLTLVFQQGNPSGIKALLNTSKKCSNILRLPLLPVTNDLYQLIALESEKIHCQS